MLDNTTQHTSGAPDAEIAQLREENARLKARLQGAAQYSTVQYSTVQFSSVQYSTVQYSTVQFSSVQYSTVQCSAVQYSVPPIYSIVL